MKTLSLGRISTKWLYINSYKMCKFLYRKNKMHNRITSLCYCFKNIGMLNVYNLYSKKYKKIKILIFCIDK